MVNTGLLLEHIVLAISLGGLSSGVVETIKSWSPRFANLEGSKMAIASVVITAVSNFTIGYFYADIATIDLIKVTVWGIVGAQAVYAYLNKGKGDLE